MKEEQTPQASSKGRFPFDTAQGPKPLVTRTTLTGYIAELKKGIVHGVGFLLTLCVGSVFAVAVSGTFNIFTPGTLLKSGDINANFATLKAAIESIPNWTKSGTTAVYNDGNVRINGRISSSVLGTFCGATAASVTGNMGGYTGAKSLCETACANTNAHMCTAHEMIISWQLGITIGSNLWYSAAIKVDVSNGFQNHHDCTGWTLNNADNAPVTITAGIAPSVAACNSSLAVACCL